VPEQVEILEDHIIGFEEKEHGKVLHNDYVTGCNQCCRNWCDTQLNFRFCLLKELPV
jgi:hypothetical protein